jgi:hypothetical protein
MIQMKITKIVYIYWKPCVDSPVTGTGWLALHRGCPSVMPYRVAIWTELSRPRIELLIVTLYTWIFVVWIRLRYDLSADWCSSDRLSQIYKILDWLIVH